MLTQDEIYHKAKTIIQKRNRLIELKRLCEEANICHKCGNELSIVYLLDIVKEQKQGIEHSCRVCNPRPELQNSDRFLFSYDRFSFPQDKQY